MMNIRYILCLFFLLCTCAAIGQMSFYEYIHTEGSKIAPDYKTANCVQFMDRSLQNFFKISDREFSRIVYINYDNETIKRALENTDTSIVGGVCYALVKYQLAKWVSVKDVKKGDIVQYWSSDGFVNGHCGIYEGRDKIGNVLMSGSHLDTKGFGIMNTFSAGMELKFYLVRLFSRQ